MIILILSILILLNIFLLYLLNRKKIKKLFFKSKINEVDISELHKIFQNSLEFDEMQYLDQFDLIFVDGGHTYSVVKNDSEKSFKMLNSNGIMLWHDYIPGKESAKDVVKYIHEILKNKKIFHLKNTSLCFYKNYS
jgi:hypothetical protein|tara:strand:- start:46 stop:453 length:408 start_codon:yes stop_codon:yes gene_type:complete